VRAGPWGIASQFTCALAPPEKIVSNIATKAARIAPRPIASSRVQPSLRSTNHRVGTRHTKMKKPTLHKRPTIKIAKPPSVR
jgi:hypothetical protein